MLTLKEKFIRPLPLLLLLCNLISLSGILYCYFCGLGLRRIEAEVVYRNEDDSLAITKIYDQESAAYQMGLEEGDRISAIAGKSVPEYFSGNNHFYLVQLSEYSGNRYPFEFYTWPFSSNKMALITVNADDLTVIKAGSNVPANLALKTFLPNRTLDILLTVQLAVGLFFWGTGLVLFFFRPAQLMTLCFNLFFGFTGIYLIANTTGSLYKDALFFSLLVLCSFICPTSFLFFTILFPKGELPRRKIQLVFLLIALSDLAVNLAYLLLSFNQQSGSAVLLNTVGIWRLRLFSVLTLSGLGVLGFRLIRSKGLERARIGLATLSILVAGLPPLLVFVLYTFFDLFSDMAINYYGLLVLPSVVIPVALLFSILKHRLLYPDLIVKAVLSHLILTVILISLYLLSSTAITLILHSAFGIGNNDFGILAIVVVAITASKILEFSRALVDRLFYRDRLNYTGLIKDWTARLLGLDTNPSKLIYAVTGELAREFRYEQIALLLLEKANPLLEEISSPGLDKRADELNAHYRLLIIGINSQSSTSTQYNPPSKQGTLEKIIDWEEIKRYGLAVNTLDLEELPGKIFGDRKDGNRKDLMECPLPLPGLDSAGYSFFIPFAHRNKVMGGLLFGHKLSGQLPIAEEINALVSLNRQISLTLHMALRIRREIYRSHLINALMLKRDSLRDEEHQRLSRELHDTTVQDINFMDSLLNTWLIAYKEKTDKAALTSTPSEAQALLERLQGLSGKLQIQLRTFIRELRVRPMETGLLVALKELLLSNMERYPAINYRFSASLEQVEEQQLSHFNEEELRHLYRMVQEAVTNATRHSQGDLVVVQVSLKQTEDANSLLIEIRDNGQGLKYDQLELPDLVLHGHYGLVTMRERAELLGGALTLTTPPAGGTVVQIEVPVRPVAQLSPSDLEAERLISEYLLSRSPEV